MVPQARMAPARDRSRIGRWTLVAVLSLTLSTIVLKTVDISGIIPGDVTVLAGLSMCVLAGLQWLKRPYPVKEVLPIILLAVYYIVHALFVPETMSISGGQFLKFVLLTVPFVLAMAMLTSAREGLEALNQAFLLAAISAAIVAMASGLTNVNEAGRVGLNEQDGGGTLGYYAALGLLCCVAILLRPRDRRRSRIPLIAVIAGMPLFGYLMVASASRGSILGAFVGLAMMLLFGTNRVRFRILALVVISIPVSWSIWVSVNELARERLVLSDESRTYAWVEAYDLFLANPWFGVGHAQLEAYLGILRYPHNILLEIAATGGIVGVTLLLWALAGAIWGISRARADPQVLLLAGVLGLFVSQAMVSLDINNRMMWFTVVACLVIPHWYGKTLRTRPSYLGVKVNPGHVGRPGGQPLASAQARGH